MKTQQKRFGKGLCGMKPSGLCFCGQNPSSVGTAAWQTVLQQQELTEV